MNNPAVKREIKIEQLQPGFILAANIQDKDGKIIAPKDSVLNDKNIERLKKYFSNEPSLKVIVFETVLKRKTPAELKKEEVEQAVKRMFEPHSGNKLYVFLKNLTLKSVEYLLDKNPELYE
ncbi:hypothetical protein KA977_04180 [Candidatus Dependentiae bacterium]|nr:hypothetical protein [Candidatus Dependentiae bacterium]